MRIQDFRLSIKHHDQSIITGGSWRFTYCQCPKIRISSSMRLWRIPSTVLLDNRSFYKQVLIPYQPSCSRIFVRNSQNDVCQDKKGPRSDSLNKVSRSRIILKTKQPIVVCIRRLYFSDWVATVTMSLAQFRSLNTTKLTFTILRVASLCRLSLESISLNLNWYRLQENA